MNNVATYRVAQEMYESLKAALDQADRHAPDKKRTPECAAIYNRCKAALQGWEEMVVNTLEEAIES